MKFKKGVYQGFGFKKGQKSWNKGKHIKFNNALKEWRKKGGISWNSGKKGYKIKPCSKKRKIKISLANKNRKHTIESKNNMSMAHKGYKMPEEQKKKIGLANSGSKSHLWKGGISKLKIYKHYRNKEYIDWRKQVFQRDNFTCLNCGNRSSVSNPVVIHPHHINSYTNFPAQRYDIDNGVTLCVPCHHQLHWGH